MFEELSAYYEYDEKLFELSKSIINVFNSYFKEDNFNDLVELDFVEVRGMEVDSPEHDLFNDIKRDYEFMGDGEAAVIALTQENGG